MIGISPEQAASQVINELAIRREDIARAKDWIIHFTGTNVSGMVQEWLRQQSIVEVREINTYAEDCGETLSIVARAYSVRLAFYHALWELISAGVLVSTASVGTWEAPLCYRTPHGSGGIPVHQISCPFPDRIHRLIGEYNWVPDTDVFIKGIDCSSLHLGILEAIDQAISCFRRGLYMPATVMLAAAAEGTWTESGAAIAKSLSDAKLLAIVSDPFSGFAKVVSEVRKTLESKGKPLLQKAGLTIHQVVDAEIWTTALRERRNALHWGKAKSFSADHSETGTLLMAAPQHLGTLEAIRSVC
ncbi:MAG: hypothetical protein ABL921_26160 [Pirellula sp.]